MPKPQNQKVSNPSFRKWVAKHKIFSVIIFIVLFLGVAYTYLSIAYLVHLRSERRQFIQAASEIDSLKAPLIHLEPTDINAKHSCQHSNFGAVFENDSIFCSAQVQSVFINANEGQRKQIIDATKQVLSKKGISLHLDNRNQSEQGIASYGFRYIGLTCSFGAWYYDQSTPLESRDATMPSQGTETETIIACGGSAQKDYFPKQN